MKSMKSIIPLSLALINLAISPVWGNEKAMNDALQQWEQELTEYKAALDYTKDKDLKASLLSNPPTGDSIAKKLWQACSYRTGTREIIEDQTSAPKSRFDKPKVRKVAVYAYEEAWAAPAVAWWLTHPNALQSILSQQESSRIATAMLQAIARTHYDKACMANVCAPLSTLSSMQAYECLKKIYLHNQDMTAKANAALGLSIMLNKASIRSIEGSEEMADAKRIYYIKNALSIAPKGCMFGNARIEDTANEQIHLVSKLSAGRIPPQITLLDEQDRQLSFPIPNQAQLLLFWSPFNQESVDLLLRTKILAEKYPQIKIIPIAVGLSKDELQQAYKVEGIGIPSYRDQEAKAAQEYRISTLPSVAFLGNRNTLIYWGYPDLNFQSKVSLFLKESVEPQAPEAPATPSAESQDNDNAVPQMRDMPEL